MSVAAPAPQAPAAGSGLALIDAQSFLNSVSARLRQNFPEGAPITIGRSRKAHATVWVPWLAGVLIPAPACHVGVSGWRLDRLQYADLQKPGAVFELCARPACRELHQAAHRNAPRRITDTVELGDGWVQEPLALIGGLSA